MSSNRWTLADVRALKVRQRLAEQDTSPRAKFGNKQFVIDGITFDSKKEGEHYLHLKMRLRLKEIDALELQPKFELFHLCPKRGRLHIGWFTPDFRYFERTADDGGEVLRVVDVKSSATKTEAYQLRKKLFEAIYNIPLLEV